MRKAVFARGAPPPIGAYSQAIEARGFLFISGQIPLSPDGTLANGSFREKARRVMENLKSILLAAGMDFRSVVRASVYLTDLGNYPEVNFVFKEYFPIPFPARSVVQVVSLPKGTEIEVDLIAMK